MIEKKVWEWHLRTRSDWYPLDCSSLRTMVLMSVRPYLVVFYPPACSIDQMEIDGDILEAKKLQVQCTFVLF